MSREKVIAATKISTGGHGEYPVRYVVLKWNRGESAHPYSRHMQVFNGTSDSYFIYGHYHCTFDDALGDMLKSMNENNKSYPYGNVSYIPGFDFAIRDSMISIIRDRIKLYVTTRFNKHIKTIQNFPKNVLKTFRKYIPSRNGSSE